MDTTSSETNIGTQVTQVSLQTHNIMLPEKKFLSTNASCTVNNTTENINALTTLILPNTTQSNYLKFPTPECHTCTIVHNTLLTVLLGRKVHSDCLH